MAPDIHSVKILFSLSIMIKKLLPDLQLMPCPPSVGTKRFWTGTNCFGRVQIILIRYKLDFSGLILIIWTCPTRFEPIQNKLGSSKTICTRPSRNDLDDPKSLYFQFHASTVVFRFKQGCGKSKFLA